MHIRVLEAFVIAGPELQDLLHQLRSRYGRDGLELSVAAPRRPPELEAHESLTALALTVPELIQNALQAQADGVDGIMVDCMADPGVEVLRETVAVPVLGPGHTSMHVGAMLGRRISLLVTTDFSSRYFLEYARHAGMDSRVASCVKVGIPPEKLETDPESTLQALCSAAQHAIVKDGADTLILCCTGFAPLSGRLKQKLASMKLAVPLIDPFAVTINALAMLIDSGLSHSGIAYPHTGITMKRHGKGLANA